MAGRNRETLDRHALLEYALRTLTRRALSESELRSRLVRRAEDPAAVDDVVAKLKESGLVNDARFAESYAAARLENQGFGRMRVLSDLRRRRVGAQVAGSAVESAFEGTDECALAERFLERKYRGKDLAQLFSEDRNVASAYRRLRLAGFSSGAAIRVLKQYAAKAEALEDADSEDPDSRGD
jgi:regulatory protein